MSKRKQDRADDPLQQEQAPPWHHTAILKALVPGSRTEALTKADDYQTRRQYMTLVILTMMWATGLVFTAPIFIGWLVGYFGLESLLTAARAGALAYYDIRITG
jgi:hypothetical protein